MVQTFTILKRHINLRMKSNTLRINIVLYTYMTPHYTYVVNDVSLRLCEN